MSLESEIRVSAQDASKQFKGALIVAVAGIVSVGFLVGSGVRGCMKERLQTKIESSIADVIKDDWVTGAEVENILKIDSSSNTRRLLSNNIALIGDSYFKRDYYDKALDMYSLATNVDGNNFYPFYSLGNLNMTRIVRYEYQTTRGLAKLWYGDKKITSVWWDASGKNMVLDQLNKALSRSQDQWWREKIRENIDALNKEPEREYVKYCIDKDNLCFKLIKN